MIKSKKVFHINSQAGSALIITIVIMVMVAIIIPIGTQMLVTTFREARSQQYSVAEADNVARAGIVDTLAWFRRQTNQPVCSGAPPTTYAWADGAFDPRYSTSTANSDTIDESIGIVKEYALSESGQKWARYEITRQTNPAVSSYENWAVHDITSERLYSEEGQTGDGIVWYIPCSGYVFLKNDSLKDYNVSPNKVVAKSRVCTEIRRISLQTQSCALLVNNGGSGSAYNVNIYKKGRIIGGSGGIGCGRCSGNSPRTHSGGYYDTSQSSYEDPTPNYVFGVNASELKTMADNVVIDVASLPSQLPDMSLIYINGDASFTSRELNGSGILFVNGDLTIDCATNSSFSGVVYVTGSATIYDTCEIYGSIVAYRGITLSRSGATGVADIVYDSSIITSVRQQICNYREIKSSYREFTGISGI